MATKTELYDRAGELGIADRDTMTKPQLADAIMELEAKGNPIDVPTPDQIIEAKKKTAEDLVVDTVAESKNVAVAAERELQARAAVVAEEERKASLRRKLPQKFLVTKGCLISSNGSLTDLAAGSIVSAATHNLDMIRRNGAIIEECTGTRLEQDQFGRIQTVAVK